MPHKIVKGKKQNNSDRKEINIAIIAILDLHGKK